MGLRESQREHTTSLIVSAAAEVFGRRGYHGTSMEEVARATGCATATLYGYFPSKEALFRTVMEDLLGAYLTGMAEAVAASSGFEGGVRAYFAHFLEFAEARQDVIRVMHTALRAAQLPAAPGSEQLEALVAAYRVALAPVFVRAEEEGLLPPGRNLDPLFTLLIGLAHSASDAWLDSGRDLRLGLEAGRTLFLGGFAATVAILPGAAP